jgi:hypothetical protein
MPFHQLITIDVHKDHIVIICDVHIALIILPILITVVEDRRLLTTAVVSAAVILAALITTIEDSC